MVTDRVDAGIRVDLGHDAAHVGNDVVVIRRRCGRRTRGRQKRGGRCVIPRAEMLAEPMRLLLDRGRGAWQNDDDVDDRAGAGAPARSTAVIAGA